MLDDTVSSSIEREVQHAYDDMVSEWRAFNAVPEDERVMSRDDMRSILTQDLALRGLSTYLLPEITENAALEATFPGV